MSLLRRLLATVALAAGCLLACAAQAQVFPDRHVRLVVPFAPGGATDVLARILAKRMAEILGQPFVVANHPGAGGTIGTDLAARAPADGYTLLMMSVLSHTAQKRLYPSLKYDPIASFAPIGSFGTTHYILVVTPSFPAKDLEGFLKLVRGEPGKYNFASAGVGSATHLAVELLMRASRTTLVHVPYQGSSPALNAVAGGHISVAFDNAATIPLIRSGQLRALAITGRQRAEALPGVPTFAEAGMSDFDVSSVFGLLAPAGVPERVVAVLNGALAQAVSDPQVREQVTAQGVEPRPGTAADFAATLKAEAEKWSRLIDEAGIKL